MARHGRRVEGGASLEARRWRRVVGGATWKARRKKRVVGGETKKARRQWRVVGGASMEARQFDGARVMSQRWSLRIVASNWKRHSGRSTGENHRRNVIEGAATPEHLQRDELKKNGHLK